MKRQPTYTCWFLDENLNELTIEEVRKAEIVEESLISFHTMQVVKKLSEIDEDVRADIYNYLVCDQSRFVQFNEL